MKEKPYIYTLSDPTTGEVRYVGKSNNPKKRLNDHIHSCHKKSTHKNNWIKSLIRESKKPILIIIDEVPIDNWQFWEMFWISKYKEDGHDLTNHDRGGNGTTEHNYNTIEKMKIRHKEFPNYNRSGGNLKKPLDKDQLYKLYITDNLSIPEMSNIMNISETTIFRNLKEYNITKDESIWKKQCASNPKKPVLQYDLQGNLIKEWETPISVFNSLKIKPERCCRGLLKTTGGFIWRYKNEWIDLGLDKLDRSTLRSVYQYDKINNLIGEFKSIKEASDKSGVNSGNIGDCCVGRLKSAGGFIWKYK